MRERLSSVETRKKIADEIRAAMQKVGRTNLEYVAIASYGPDPSVNGLRIPQITARRGREPGLDSDIETVLDMLSQQESTSVIYHSWSEPGVELIMKHPAVAVARDSGAQKPDPYIPHPRSYGSHSRVLGLYVREKGVLRLEEAIRKMTSLPSRTFRLHDRGLIEPGYAADLVLFDEEQVRDLATFEEPHQYSKGFHYVIVNGVMAVEEGNRTPARPGRILRIRQNPATSSGGEGAPAR